MRYKAPYGSVDPDAAYVDKDVPGAVAGSRVPRQAVEHPQKEIANAIDFFLGTGAWASGQDADDLHQLRKAIQRAGRGSSADIAVKGWQSAPPGGPAEGDLYIVKAAGTGAWAGHDHAIALYQAGAWVFQAPPSGLQANYVDSGRYVVIWFSGAAWAEHSPVFPPGAKPSHIIANRTNQASFGNNVFTQVSGMTTVASQLKAGTAWSGSALTIGAADAGMWFFSAVTIMTTEEVVVRYFKNGTGFTNISNGDGYVNQTEYGRYSACSGAMPVAAGDVVNLRVYQRNGPTNSKTLSNAEFVGFRLE